MQFNGIFHTLIFLHWFLILDPLYGDHAERRVNATIRFEHHTFFSFVVFFFVEIETNHFNGIEIYVSQQISLAWTDFIMEMYFFVIDFKNIFFELKVDLRQMPHCKGKWSKTSKMFEVELNKCSSSSTFFQRNNRFKSNIRSLSFKKVSYLLISIHTYWTKTAMAVFCAIQHRPYSPFV